MNAVMDIGAGEPLLLLHGFTGCGANWEMAGITAVLGKQYRLIVPDLLGHGRAPAPQDPADYAMPHAAQALADLLNQLAISQTNLLGYSMGGRLALYFALHYPQRIHKLILESASPGLADPTARAQRRHSDNALADRIERDGIPAFVDFWESLPLWDSQAKLPLTKQLALRQQRLQNSAHGLANSLRGMGTGVQPSLWDNLPQLDKPTLLLAGELDAKFVAINQQMVAHMPHARLEIVPQAGHTIHLEQPAHYAQQVRQFFTA